MPQIAVNTEYLIDLTDKCDSKNLNIDLDYYMGRGEKMFDYDAQEYIRELRSSDRL
ncbi:MAG: hypothetical protein IJ520_07740 [Synergistaceae bacterium]|nr:hypothetical protein [Synergistaceae bacterium]